MSRLYVLQKWNEYRETLEEGLPLHVISEARDAFYGGVIAGRAIMESTHGEADQDMRDECRAYIRMLQARLDELEKRH